jgi:hypothetical protein
MRFILVALLLFSFTGANAALVDNGGYTTDSASTLDWLDLEATAGLTINDALASNATWRLASNSEVENLFAQLFPNYVSTQPTDDYADSSRGGYLGQEEDAVAFRNLFGVNQYGSQSGRNYSYGYYYDEDNTVRMMGVSITQFVGDEILGSGVFGMDFQSSHPDAESTLGHSAFGTYLVRTTAVPVPAAVWLFGSALAGLGWFRRKSA